MVENRAMFQCEECKKWFVAMEVFVRHPCVTKAAAENMDTSGILLPRDETGFALPLFTDENTERKIDNKVKIQETQQEEMTWTSAATKLMLSEYKKRQIKIDEGKLKKKKAFDEISEVLKQKMYLFSGDQCATRMKTITRTYKQTKDHNMRSGNSRKDYIYQKELDEMFGDKPNVNPVCVVSSQENLPKTEESTSETDVQLPEQESPMPGKKRKDSNSPEEESLKRKVRKNNKMSEVLEYLESQSMAAERRRQEEEQKKEKRHIDRMQLLKEFINVLKNK